MSGTDQYGQGPGAYPANVSLTVPPTGPRPLAELSLTALLDELAAERAAPGGGAAAAWVAALAAGLVEMASGLTLARDGYADHDQRLSAILGRARELRAQALELAERDLEAYAPMLQALRLRRDDSDRPARLAAARSSAAQTPLRLAQLGAELAELASEIARTSSPNLAGDAIVGVLLAEAACKAASLLVDINLDADARATTGAERRDPRCREAAALAQRALAVREQLCHERD